MAIVGDWGKAPARRARPAVKKTVPKPKYNSSSPYVSPGQLPRTGSPGNPSNRNKADSYKPPAPSKAYRKAVAQAPRAPAPAPVGPGPLGTALLAGGTGAAVGAATPVAPPPPKPIYSGSGRVRGYSGGGGGGGAAAPAIAAPAMVAPPPAAVQPPAVVNPVGPGAGNVAGKSFTKVGTGQGTYGQEQRRRMARGPVHGLSITPEMLRRAAGQRLG